MALTQQSDGTSYKKPIGNKNKGNGSKKQPTIPLPNMGAQVGKSGGNAQLGKPGQYNPSSQDLLQKYGDISDKMPYAGMTGNSSEAQANPLPYYGRDIPMPINPQYVGQRRFSGYDYPMMADSARWNAIGEDYGYDMRDLIDSRFPGGVTLEDILAYLPDNYAWLQPEETSQMTPGTQDPNGGGSGGYGGYGGYGGSYIPMPDYSTWGGGGYGNNNGYRDSGLVNWRI